MTNSCEFNNIIVRENVESFSRIPFSVSKMIPLKIYPNEIIQYMISKENGQNIFYWYSDIENPHFFVNAYAVFRDSKIQNVTGLSSFNLSTTCNLDELFSGCTKLTSIEGCEDWYVNNVVSMKKMFFNCHLIKTFEPISKWSTSHVDTLEGTFEGCSQIEDLSFLSEWDTSSLTYMMDTFKDCKNLKTIKGLANWNVEKVIAMLSVFSNTAISNLEGLEKWNLLSFKHMSTNFANNKNLSNISAIKGWNTPNLAIIMNNFKNCPKLKDKNFLTEETKSRHLLYIEI